MDCHCSYQRQEHARRSRLAVVVVVVVEWVAVVVAAQTMHSSRALCGAASVAHDHGMQETTTITILQLEFVLQAVIAVTEEYHTRGQMVLQAFDALVEHTTQFEKN